MRLFAGNLDIQVRNKRRGRPGIITAAALLAGLLTAFALAGCTGGGSQESGSESSTASGQTAKGRYMETKLTMSEEAKGKNMWTVYKMRMEVWTSTLTTEGESMPVTPTTAQNGNRREV